MLFINPSQVENWVELSLKSISCGGVLKEFLHSHEQELSYSSWSLFFILARSWSNRFLELLTSPHNFTLVFLSAANWVSKRQRSSSTVEARGGIVKWTYSSRSWIVQFWSNISFLFSDMLFACSSTVTKEDWLTSFSESISPFKQMLSCLSVSSCRTKGASSCWIKL